jgi:hypothetical protein
MEQMAKRHWQETWSSLVLLDVVVFEFALLTALKDFFSFLHANKRCSSNGSYRRFVRPVEDPILVSVCCISHPHVVHCVAA